MPTTPETQERRDVVRRLKTLAAQHQRTTARLAALEDQRAEAYEAARALEPPITFRHIASIFGCSEAAVMQHLTRRRERTQ